MTFPLDKPNQALAFWPPSFVPVQHRYRTSSPTLLFRCPGIFCKSPLLMFLFFFSLHSFSIARHHCQTRFNHVVLFSSDITGMASSSVSQEDFDNDFELTSRRSRIRTARARVVPPRTDSCSINFQSNKYTFVLLLSCALWVDFSLSHPLLQRVHRTWKNLKVCATPVQTVCFRPNTRISRTSQ